MQSSNGVALPVLMVIKALAAAAAPPKRSGSPKKSGLAPIVVNRGGEPVLRIDGFDRKGIRLTLFRKGGVTREDAETAIKEFLDQHWA